MQQVDIIGYVATLIVIISFLLDGFKLRLINSVGCILFIVYGLLKGVDVPVLTTNGVILLLNLKYMLWKKKEN